MIEGKEQWNLWFQKEMGDVTIGDRTVYTFPKMKKNFYEMLKETAAKFPDKTGVYDNWERTYTYRKFLKMTDELAAYLKCVHQVEKGMHVGLLLNNGIEFAVSFYALCKLGAVAVPFPTKYREPEVRALIEKADLCGILISEDYGWAESYRESGLVVETTRKEALGYGFAHLFQHDRMESSIHGEVGCGELNDEMILMFTSGTTSASKGVILKNYNLNHAVMIYQKLLELGPEDTTLIPVPIYHITGLVALLGLFVYIGGTIHLHKNYDAKRILKDIDRYGVTFMHGSPTVFQLLLNCCERLLNLPTLRMLACGSSYMPVETMKQLHSWLPQMEFRSVYGMTETSSPGTIFPYDAATSLYPRSGGKLIPGLFLKVLDDAGNEVPDGVVGTIYLKGPTICEYYYRLETPMITKDGWLNTGDMGYINEDAYVFIADRKKDMINRGGEKIWSFDVENELYKIKNIQEAAVVGMPDEIYGEVPVAAVKIKPGAAINKEDIQNELTGKIARYKMPVQIIILDKLPETPSGKIDKKAIRKLFTS